MGNSDFALAVSLGNKEHHCPSQTGFLLVYSSLLRAEGVDKVESILPFEPPPPSEYLHFGHIPVISNSWDRVSRTELNVAPRLCSLLHPNQQVWGCTIKLAP